MGIRNSLFLPLCPPPEGDKGGGAIQYTVKLIRNFNLALMGKALRIVIPPRCESDANIFIVMR